MLRRKIEKKLEFWKNNRKQALLVTGARQIGKTYSISTFINNNFENVIEINFAIRTDLIDTFVQLDNSKQLLLRLSLFEGSKMKPGSTVVFFDEIQLLYQRRDELKKQGKLDPGSQDLLTAIKSAVIENEYRFILSGSLLGVSVKDVVLNPVGYLDVLTMYPMDFEEFLWAKGVGEAAIEHVKESFINKEKVDNAIHNSFMKLFEEYALIGGMPEVVYNYIANQNLHLVQTIQQQIINAYAHDITTYIENDGQKLRIREIYNAIPSELNSKNKRFVSSHVLDKQYLKNNKIEDEFLWLTNAGIAIPTYNVTEVSLPLFLASERKTLKLFMNDIGLLDSMLFSTGVRQKILNKETNINFGAPFENIAAQELIAHGFDKKLYYYNSKKHGEIDFIIEYNNKVLPIEIKSGKPNEMSVYNHSALNNVIKNYSIDEAYVFGGTNVIKENDIVYGLPIYMISFVKNEAADY